MNVYFRLSEFRQALLGVGRYLWRDCASVDCAARTGAAGDLKVSDISTLKAHTQLCESCRRLRADDVAQPEAQNIKAASLFRRWRTGGGGAWATQGLAGLFEHRYFGEQGGRRGCGSFNAIPIGGSHSVTLATYCSFPSLLARSRALPWLRTTLLQPFAGCSSSAMSG